MPVDSNHWALVVRNWRGREAQRDVIVVRHHKVFMLVWSQWKLQDRLIKCYALRSDGGDDSEEDSLKLGGLLLVHFCTFFLAAYAFSSASTWKYRPCIAGT